MKTPIKALFIFLMGFSVNNQADVLDHHHLQSYLPEKIEGYEAGSPEGQTTTVQGLTFSSASIEFSNSTDGYINITLLDYAGASNMYQAAVATWSAGITFDNDQVNFKEINWSEKIIGWEQFHKSDKISYLALGIAERFFLTIEANQQNDTELVKSIAHKMDLQKLAAE
ncbi:MAG: hypothetical protein KQI35_10410 [Bacteroidetes bacterium]|nr:hypothetical protein [Bacteroidota bacterium]